MKAFWWKFRYAWFMWRVIRGWNSRYREWHNYPMPSLYRDWCFSWESAGCAYDDFSDEDPVDSADSEMSYWEQ